MALAMVVPGDNVQSPEVDDPNRIGIDGIDMLWFNC